MTGLAAEILNRVQDDEVEHRPEQNQPCAQKPGNTYNQMRIFCSAVQQHNQKHQKPRTLSNKN